MTNKRRENDPWANAKTTPIADMKAMMERHHEHGMSLEEWAAEDDRRRLQALGVEYERLAGICRRIVAAFEPYRGTAIEAWHLRGVSKEDVVDLFARLKTLVRDGQPDQESGEPRKAQ